jgi:hypothetical protein
MEQPIKVRNRAIEKSWTWTSAAGAGSWCAEAVMNDAPDLIARLLAVAGMIMEDTAEAALIADPGSSPEASISSVAQAGSDISAMSFAAAAIARRYADPPQ